MEFRFRPHVEWLEVREVPAITWEWSPQGDDYDGNKPANWLKDGVRQAIDFPDGTDDNLKYVAMVNKPCNLKAGQGSLGTITVEQNYNSMISISVGTTFTGASILSTCTINLNGQACDFGNGTLGNPATSTQVTVTGGGSIFVSNLKTTDLLIRRNAMPRR